MESLWLNISQAEHLMKLKLDMSDAKCYIRADYPLKSNVTLVVNKIEYDAFKKIDRVLGPEFKYVPTYALQEIWEKLPSPIYVGNEKYIKHMYSNGISYAHSSNNIRLKAFCNNGALCDAYNMLCWVIENGHLNVE